MQCIALRGLLRSRDVTRIMAIHLLKDLILLDPVISMISLGIFFQRKTGDNKMDDSCVKEREICITERTYLAYLSLKLSMPQSPSDGVEM